MDWKTLTDSYRKEFALLKNLRIQEKGYRGAHLHFKKFVAQNYK